MNSKNITLILMLAGFSVVIVTGSAFAAGIPFWWDNPQGYPLWMQVIGTGTASNTGPQAQFVIAKIDVPNEYRENAFKHVWIRVEWSLIYGSGKLATGFTDNMILWINDPQLCPPSPELPFPDPPSGWAFLVYEGPFTSLHGYVNGNEFSYSAISPQPACERLEIRFEVNPNSRIDYRIEVQTLCMEWDFGDAPDPQYPTILANDGARHMLLPNLYMGSLIDFEADGQPNASATGDDIAVSDDEDGVVFTNYIHPGATADIDVTASAAGVLNAWMDMNANGSWGDAGEQIFTNEPLVAGVNALSFGIPGNTPIGQTFARFRFSSESDLSYTGEAIDGEVEDYMVEIGQPRYDFGDAPDPSFPTLLASDGARHLVVDQFHLGALIDHEPNGVPTADAIGDDNNQPDNDEDGVEFPAQLIQGSPATINVTASAAGLLNAWFDFNNDGDWDDPSEHVFVNTPLAAGLNPLNMIVPVTHQPDLMAITRFRFSSVADLPYDGPAPDGEVEDYRVSVLVPVELSSFTAVFMTEGVNLQWVTQSESDNLGFNIYRAENENDNFERINNELIPGAGNSSSANYYSYFDLNVLAGKSYYYKLADVSFDGKTKMHGPISITVNVPNSYQLEQNYPNPFNPDTKISFRIKDTGHVTLTIHNTLGQLVRTLVSEQKQAGYYSVIWNGTDANGNSMPSGTYIYKLKIKGYEASKTMQYLK